MTVRTERVFFGITLGSGELCRAIPPRRSRVSFLKLLAHQSKSARRLCQHLSNRADGDTDQGVRAGGALQLFDAAARCYATTPDKRILGHSLAGTSGLRNESSFSSNLGEWPRTELECRHD
jgi:hypothetical protein